MLQPHSSGLAEEQSYSRWLRRQRVELSPLLDGERTESDSTSTAFSSPSLSFSLSSLLPSASTKRATSSLLTTASQYAASRSSRDRSAQKCMALLRLWVTASSRVRVMPRVFTCGGAEATRGVTMVMITNSSPQTGTATIAMADYADASPTSISSAGVGEEVSQLRLAKLRAIKALLEANGAEL